MSKTSLRIGKGSFEGHAVITLATRALKMSIVTDAGPRIAFFGKPKGRNLLYWDRQGLGRGEWKLMGGHRVWPTRPGADESEDGYRADNGKCSAQVRGDSVTVISETDPVFNTKRGITVRIADENHVEVENFIENQGPMLYSCGAWALTCTLPAKGTAYGVPLGDGSDWDCFKLVLFKTWGGGHTSRLRRRPGLVHARPAARPPEGARDEAHAPGPARDHRDGRPRLRLHLRQADRL